MAYQRKTYDEWELWTNYGYGWECECCASTYKEAKEDYKAYRDNATRLIGIKIKKCRRKIKEE